MSSSTSKVLTSEASTSDASTSDASTSKASTSEACRSLTFTIQNELDLVNKWYEDLEKSEKAYNEDQEKGKKVFNDIIEEARKLGGKILNELDWRFRASANDFFGYMLKHARKICDDKYTITKEDRDELEALIRRGFFSNQLKFSEKPKIDPCFAFESLYFKLTTNQINEKEFKTRISAVLVEVEKLVDEWYDTYMKYIMTRVFRTIYNS